MSEPLTFVPKPSLQFFDAANNREMLYVYPDSQHWTAGRLLYQNPGDGQWVTLRKATDTDLAAINGAIVRGHHG